MTVETTNQVRCPHCNTAFRALPEHAGRRAKCSHCGGTIVVPGEPVKPPPPPSDLDLPQYVGVNCSLCGTRMYGTLADVGTELKCPDCGRLTKLPPPEIKKKNIPAALEGEQYELWEGNDQPWGVELSAAGPQYVSVECRLCQTHLQATIDQVGKKIICHECGAGTLVRLPPTGAKPKPAVPVDEYEVDEASTVPSVSLASFYETDIAESDKKEDSIQRGAKPQNSKRATPLDADFAPRPKLPAWPLLTGNFSFLGSEGVPARVVVMSMTMLIPGFLVVALLVIGSQIVAIALLPALVIMGLIWFAALAASSMAIVTESSEGSDQVHSWPSSSVMDWMPELAYFIFALFVSAFPGWLIAQLSPEIKQFAILPMAASVLLIFPVVLLSQLAGGSIFAAWSPTVTMSWFRCTASWIGFYLQSIAIAFVIGVTLLGMFTVSLWLILVLCPLSIVGVYYYFRIMGRLAWVITESTPVAEEEEEEDRPKRRSDQLRS